MTISKPEVRTDRKMRKCLGRLSNGELHNEMFLSDGPWDRICPSCKSTARYKEGVDAQTLGVKHNVGRKL